jgi:hypothetical protein
MMVESVTGLLIAAVVMVPLPAAWLLTALTARAVHGDAHPRVIYMTVAVGSAISAFGVGMAATAPEGLGGLGEVLFGWLLFVVGGLLALAAAAGGYLRTRSEPRRGDGR